jgi:predicted nucleic acid-binding protein
MERIIFARNVRVERLRTLLGPHRCVALDTSIFIYHLEANPRYIALTDCIFEWLDANTSVAVTSVITLTELLVKPYRESDEMVQKTYSLLSTYPHIEWLRPSLEIAALAAKIRAMHRLRTPDALQAATGVHAKATAMLTNDPIFKRVSGFEALVLDDYT